MNWPLALVLITAVLALASVVKTKMEQVCFEGCPGPAGPQGPPGEAGYADIEENVTININLIDLGDDELDEEELAYYQEQKRLTKLANDEALAAQQDADEAGEANRDIAAAAQQL